jgi:cytochrome c oxidase assembly protein subunit 15
MNAVPLPPLSHAAPRPILGPILTLGFAIAVCVWIVAYVMHLPWLNLRQNVAAPTVLAAWLFASVITGRAAPSYRRMLIAGGAGTLSAVLSLLILGAKLSQPLDATTPAPGASGLIPDAPLLAAGFVALGTVVGLIGGLIGQHLGPSKRADGLTAADWLARLAVVVCFSILPLLISGGGVTSTRSGMAIIGWPDSYGANMFLYPIALMTAHPQAYFEHAHRLFGTLVGLATFALMFYAFAATRNSRHRVFAAFLFILVVAQGLLGAIRVRLGVNQPQSSVHWALLHGIVAQLFFAAAVFVAAELRPAFSLGRTLPPFHNARPITLATWLLPVATLQLALGATYRHLGQPHALWTHAAFSLVVVALASMTGFGLKKLAADAPDGSRPASVRSGLKRIGRGLAHVVGLQFLLGWAALGIIGLQPSRTIPVGAEIHTAEQVGIAEALIRTAHQANGALLLAFATLAFVWARWLRRPISG